MSRACRRVLMISPHFPPDGSAGAHRVRVVAPYLAEHGWSPTVLSVAPASYEGRLDDELAEAVDGRIAVIRVAAWPAAATRRVGLGDLGLRAFLPLYRAARAIPSEAIYLTTYPVYPAAFGPRLKRALGAPLVVDLQDPWVGEWGRTVGGGPGGTPDWKSRASRTVAARIERAVLPHADAVTSVSTGLLDELAARVPGLQRRPRLTMPIGIDPCDRAWADTHPREVAAAPPPDGNVHIAYVGTMLPLAYETLDAVLAALGRVRQPSRPGTDRLRLHLVGTSNQTGDAHRPLVTPRALLAGVADVVHETPGRIPYLDAMRVAARSSVVLLMGTSESRYTASKLQIALASGRPLLAVVHGESDVARTLAPLAERDPAIALVTYTDAHRASAQTGAIADVLTKWSARLPERRADTRFAPGTTGPELAAALAALLDRVRGSHA